VVWRVLVLAVVVGVCIGLVSGFVENKLGGVTIPEKRHYGFPLVWRTTDPFVGEKHYYFEVLVDILFWIAIVSVAVLLAKKLAEG